MSELLSCPFCGMPPAPSEAREAGGHWYLHCLDCDMDGPVGYSLAEAIAAWNRRAPARGGEGYASQTTQEMETALADAQAEVARLREALQLARGYVLSAYETGGVDDDVGWVIRRDLEVVDAALEAKHG